MFFLVLVYRLTFDSVYFLYVLRSQRRMIHCCKVQIPDSLYTVLPQLATMWPAAHDLWSMSHRQFPTKTGNYSAQTQLHWEGARITMLQKWPASIEVNLSFGPFWKNCKNSNVLIRNWSDCRRLIVYPCLSPLIDHICLIFVCVTVCLCVSLSHACLLPGGHAGFWLTSVWGLLDVKESMLSQIFLWCHLCHLLLIVWPCLRECMCAFVWVCMLRICPGWCHPPAT